MNRRERFALAMDHRQPDHVLSDFGKYIGSFEKAAYIRMREYLQDPSMKNDELILDPMAENILTDEKLGCLPFFFHKPCLSRVCCCAYCCCRFS